MKIVQNPLCERENPYMQSVQDSENTRPKNYLLNTKFHHNDSDYTAEVAEFKLLFHFFYYKYQQMPAHALFRSFRSDKT